MAIAKLLGRIGMLIVTLSIGIALVAMPTVAFAEPDAGSPASSSESSSTDSPETDSASTASQSGGAESADGAHTDSSGGPAAGQPTAPTPNGSPSIADPTDDGGPVPETATSESAEPPNTKQPAADTEVEGSATDRDAETTARTSVVLPSDSSKKSDSSQTRLARTTGRVNFTPVNPGRPDAQISETTRLSHVDSASVRAVPVGPEIHIDAKPQAVPVALSGAEAPASGIVRLVTSVVRMIVSPFLTHGPFSPMESPIQWALMAFARGDVGRMKVDRVLPAPGASGLQSFGSGQDAKSVPVQHLHGRRCRPKHRAASQSAAA